MPEMIAAAIDIPELKTDFIFRRRPMSIPADLRPAWRIGLATLLVNKCCRGAKTSMTRLHVLSWAIRTGESRDALLSVLDDTVLPNTLVIRFEPSLNRAVDFAIGESLISRPAGNRIELTSAGKQVAEELWAAEEAFVPEKQFINTIRGQVTESLVRSMFQGAI